MRWVSREEQLQRLRRRLSNPEKYYNGGGKPIFPEVVIATMQFDCIDSSKIAEALLPGLGMDVEVKSYNQGTGKLVVQCHPHEKAHLHTHRITFHPDGSVKSIEPIVPPPPSD